jgi:hypothetical protein
MAASWVAICNQALISLGSNIIASLTEDTSNAKLCNSLYRQVADECLVEHDWACATTRMALAPLSTAPTSELWEYQFQIPAYPLCLKIQSVDPDSPWKREGQVILSNESELTLVYTYQVINPAEIDTALARAIAGKLAALLAPKIAAKEAPLKEQLSERDMLKARWADQGGKVREEESVEGETLAPVEWEKVT